MSLLVMEEVESNPNISANVITIPKYSSKKKLRYNTFFISNQFWQKCNNNTHIETIKWQNCPYLSKQTSLTSIVWPVPWIFFICTYLPMNQYHVVPTGVAHIYLQYCFWKSIRHCFEENLKVNILEKILKRQK